MTLLRQIVRSGRVARAAGTMITTAMGTTRSEVIDGVGVETEYVGKRPALYLLWHGRLLLCAHRYRHHDLGTLISQNRDGDQIAGMIQGWGYHVIRGSSSRGSTPAMRELIEWLGAGNSAALTPDGPRGPRQHMKIGPVKAAARSGVPIVPVSAGASRAGVFGRWDRFLVPAPFARCPFAIGTPITVPGDSTEQQLKECAREVEYALNRLTDMVDEAARRDR